MRTLYSIINLTVAWVGQFLVLGFQLINRYFFARCLSAEYMGVSGLFSNVLSMLALAELGVGSAMTFSLYVPLAQHKVEKIKSLMRFYRNAYRVIGIFILVSGLALLPIYPYFIAETPDIPHLDLIYLLYVINSASSYFFTYKRSLIISDQRKYVESFVYYGRVAVMNIAQIVILLTTRNFILYLVCQFICQILENVVISRIADRMYPYLKEKDVELLESEDLKLIKRNVGALFTHKVGEKVVNSTSSILVSKFISLSVAGIYSSYSLVSSSVNSIVGQAFNAITGSVGNLEASENPDKIFAVFRKIYFFNYFVAGFCTICMLCLFQPFIELWLGTDYLLTQSVMILICVDFYIQTIRKAVLTFRNASASYYYDRFKPVAESIINLVFSLWLIQVYGLTGLLVGRIASTLLTCNWVEAFVLYRHVFFEKFRDFIKRFIAYALIIFLDSFLAYKLFGMIVPAGGGILHFIIQLLFAVVISLALMMISTCWMQEFRSLLGMCVGYVKKFLGKT